MKVFFTASFQGKKEYQKYYDLVLKTLKNTGVEVLSPEVGNYLSVLEDKDFEKIKSKKKIHYKAIKKGIHTSQAVIIEVSNEDFQLGHEATLAIQSKKPVLCLSIHEDMSDRIISPYFYGAKYNEYNLEEIIDNFLKHSTKEDLNQRFNLFLSKRQLSLIEEAAKKEGMNNSEYIRLLIDRDQK